MHTKVPTKWLVKHTRTHGGTNKRLARESTTNMYSYTSKQKKKKHTKNWLSSRAPNDRVGSKI